MFKDEKLHKKVYELNERVNDLYKETGEIVYNKEFLVEYRVNKADRVDEEVAKLSLKLVDVKSELADVKDMLREVIDYVYGGEK